MRGNETPGQIVTNCCTGVGVHDIITCANLYYDRLWGLGVAGGQILGFSIDLLRRPYNTLALPCECVMTAIFACNRLTCSKRWDIFCVCSEENCNRMLNANGAHWLCSRLMDHDLSRQLLFRSIEILWNVLENCTNREQLGLQLNDVLCVRCTHVSVMHFMQLRTGTL